jgi:ribosomal protein S18 acetylase RimI-like enzyme
VPIPGVSFRDLEPSDLPWITDVHVASFPESTMTVMGLEVVRRYYHWQLTGPHDSIAIAVEADDQPAGFCFGGLFRGAMAGFVRQNRVYLALCVLSRPWLLRRPDLRTSIGVGLRVFRRSRGQPTARGDAAERSRSFGILAIAIHPRHQGLGLGTKLLFECERIARERGFTQMHLNVHPSNHSAIRVYRRCGWESVPDQVPWNGRMRKILSSTTPG